MSITKKVTLQSLLYPTMMYLTIDSNTGNLIFSSKPFIWDCTVYQEKVDGDLTDIITAAISHTNEKGQVLSLEPDYKNPLAAASYPAIAVEEKGQVVLRLTRQQNDDLDSIFSINAPDSEGYYYGGTLYFSLKSYKDEVVFNHGENLWNIVDV